MNVRSPSFGYISNIERGFLREFTLDLFRTMCRIRFFEEEVRRAFDSKFIKMPIYLSIGQEAIAAALSKAFKADSIFAQHRAHDLYLAYGGNVDALVRELLHKEDGCAGGMGGSASIHSPEIGMFGHSGLMGDQVPISVGYALGTNNRTLSVMGDASGEEDYALGALGYAATKKAPVLFVCFDNGLSILTKVDVRRSWNLVDVASSFGMPSVEISDNPWLISHWVNQLKHNLPAFLNIQTARNVWHAGTGNDGDPEWDRFSMTINKIAELGYEADTEKILSSEKAYASRCWENHLQGASE